MDLSAFVVNPATLIFVVMALVQFIKDLGLKGNVLRIVSLAIGGGIAGIYQARALWPAYAVYIDIAFFVVAVGLGASGAYSLIDERIPKRS
jgi:hypothetical protein